MKKYQFHAKHKDYITPNIPNKKTWCPSFDIYTNKIDHSQPQKEKETEIPRKKSIFTCDDYADYEVKISQLEGEQNALCKSVKHLESDLKHTKFELKEE